MQTRPGRLHDHPSSAGWKVPLTFKARMLEADSDAVPPFASQCGHRHPANGVRPTRRNRQQQRIPGRVECGGAVLRCDELRVATNGWYHIDAPSAADLSPE